MTFWNMIQHGQTNDINIQDLTIQIIGKYQTYEAIIHPQQNTCTLNGTLFCQSN